MEEDKVTSEQIIWCILNRIPNRTKKEEKILARLKRKQGVAKEQNVSAEEYCMRQGWIESVHHVEEHGETTRSYHTIEVTESGRSQAQLLWSASKYNPKNWWKKPLLWTIAGVIISLGILVLNLLKLIEI